MLIYPNTFIQGQYVYINIFSDENVSLVIEVSDKTVIKDLTDVLLLDVYGDEIVHYSLKKKDSVSNRGFFMTSIIVPHEVLLLNIYR